MEIKEINTLKEEKEKEFKRLTKELNDLNKEKSRLKRYEYSEMVSLALNRIDAFRKTLYPNTDLFEDFQILDLGYSRYSPRNGYDENHISFGTKNDFVIELYENMIRLTMSTWRDEKPIFVFNTDNDHNIIRSTENSFMLNNMIFFLTNKDKK